MCLVVFSMLSLGRILISDLVANLLMSRLTVVSREAKKKQHACTSSGARDHYSELFTRMAALKLQNAVNQPL